MPKLVKAKSKSTISKSVPRDVAMNLFDDVGVSPRKAAAKVSAKKAVAKPAVKKAPAKKVAPKAKVVAKPAVKKAPTKAVAKPAVKKAPAKKVAVKAKPAPAAPTRAARATKVVAKAPVKRKSPLAATRAKKVTATKTPRTRRAPKVVEAIKPVKVKFTKAGLITHLAEQASTDKKTSKAMLDSLTQLMLGSIAPRGAGTFTLPGVLRIVTRKVPSRKGGAMVMNRFTNEMVKQKAKAAYVRVKVRPMAGLKNAAL